MAKATPVADDSVIITEAADGKSFTVSDNPNYVPEPLKVPEYYSESMNKNDVIGLAIVGSLFAAFVGGIGWFSYKEDQKIKAETAARKEEQKRKRAERQAWFDKQRKDGKTVIETWEGEYMAIPNEAYAAAEVRPKGQ